MEGVWEPRLQSDDNNAQVGNGQHRLEMADSKSAHSENCLERTLHCLSHVPCASLVAWIALLVGLGGLTGSLLVGAHRTRDLLEEKELLWFMEYTIIGVVCGMFVIGTCLLVLGHVSSEPSCRHCFNTSGKNTCGRVLNIMMLVLSYILCVAWVLASALLFIPVTGLGLLLYLVDIKRVTQIDLANYGFNQRLIVNADTERGLEKFTAHGKDLLHYYGAAYISAVIIIISLVHFLMCISANVTHLREARLATLNAYDDAEEAHPQSPPKQLNDTTM
ncbi:uncharacterized protein LOC127876662 isoform X4 [Dreissena polymorpha]|uniref:uncharacterized protein LOC127876662 isoform X4 n=1 Tax=Dreissena polymorpha TaxID=45954 RepID=UPI002264E765|nr:uncharacterized protein LOC127876662 isoform X4 [Dreissena polymorpha]